MKAVADTSPAHAGPVRAAQAAPKVSLRRVNIARARWQIYPAAATLPPMELSGKGAIGRGAGQGRKMAPRRSFWSPQHVTSEHWLTPARYLSITVAKRAHRPTAVSPGMNLQDSSRDQSVVRRCRAGGEIQMIARATI